MAGPGVARADSRRRLPLAATLVVVALAIVVIAALTADAMVEPAPQPDAQPVARPPADRGVWYCPVTGQEEERVALSIAAVGDAVSRATVVRYPEGEQREDAPIDLDPGTQQRIVLEAEDARAPVTVRWEGGPVVVSWRAHGGKVVAGPCEPAPASTWYVPGFDTTLGSESTLHLFNPFTTDAVARVSYATPQGMVDLLSTENVPVGAGTSVRLNLNDYQPEQPDLGVIVEVLAGRLVAQGEVRIAPPGEDEEGPKGRTLLPAATTPAQTTWFGYGAIGSNTQSWLAVFNPTDTDTAVEVRVSDPVAELSAYGEVPVNAGTAVRIDLTDHSTENLFGITLEAVGNVPVVAARFTSIGTAEVASTAAALGVVEAASTRAIVGGGADVRAGTVAVYNPGEETIRMTVDAGTRTPAAWTGIELPANGFTTLDVADAGVDRAEIPLRVSADGPVVATLRSSRRNDPVSALWTLPGVPASAWVGPPTRPPCGAIPHCSRRLRRYWPTRPNRVHHEPRRRGLRSGGMVDELRSCRRTACRWPAAASLSFRYETRQVWLEDLAAETNPARWDLCPHHADTLVVPRGWERVDRRSSPPAPTEPSWRERRRAATSSPPSPRPDSPGADALTAPRRNRYAALSAALPELAAALAAGGSSPMAGHGDAETGEASPGATVLPLDRWSSDRSASERGPEQN